MELLAGISLFVICLLFAAICLLALATFLILYKILEKLSSYEVVTDPSPALPQETPTRKQTDSANRITPPEADSTVPLDQFTPKPGLTVVRKDVDDTDEITPLDNE